MLGIAESVYDWNGCVLGHSFNGVLVKSAQYDGVNPALKIMGDVAQFFPRIQSLLGLIYEKRSPSEARHACFKCQPSSQRRLLEKHGHLLTGEGAAESLRTRFHNSREMQYGGNAFATQVASRNEIVSPKRVGNPCRHNRRSI